MPRGRGRSLTLAAATPQHPVRQPINARSDSMGFGVIGSGMRTANVRMPAGCKWSIVFLLIVLLL